MSPGDPGRLGRGPIDVAWDEGSARPPAVRVLVGEQSSTPGSSCRRQILADPATPMDAVPEGELPADLWTMCSDLATQSRLCG